MSDIKDHNEQWDDHRVFEFLQETSRRVAASIA